MAVRGDLAIYYSDTIDGTYTAVNSGVSSGDGFDSVATDGVRVFSSRGNDSNSLVVWTSDLFGSATFRQRRESYGVKKSGNKIYCKSYDSNSGAGVRKLWVYNESKDDFTNAKAFVSGEEKYIQTTSGPFYVNGKYYAAFGVWSSSGSNQYAIYTSDDGITFNNMTGGGSVQHIYCAIDNVLVTTNGALYNINSNGSVSNIGTLGVSPLDFENCDGMNSSDIAFVCTKGSASTTTSTQVQISWVNASQFVLPSISLNKTYTYIKAKT